MTLEYVLERLLDEASDPASVEGVAGVFVVPLPTQHIERDEYDLPAPNPPEYLLTMVDVPEPWSTKILEQLEDIGWVAWPAGETAERILEGKGEAT